MIFLNNAKTDTGVLRTENQDSFGVCPEKNFFFLTVIPKISISIPKWSEYEIFIKVIFFIL